MFVAYAVMLMSIGGCITGGPVNGPGSNNTNGGSQPPPIQSPPSPNSINQYGTGSSGAGACQTARVVYILLLCTAAFFTLYGK